MKKTLIIALFLLAGCTPKSETTSGHPGTLKQRDFLTANGFVRVEGSNLYELTNQAIGAVSKKLNFALPDMKPEPGAPRGIDCRSVKVHDLTFYVNANANYELPGGALSDSSTRCLVTVALTYKPMGVHELTPPVMPASIPPIDAIR